MQVFKVEVLQYSDSRAPVSEEELGRVILGDPTVCEVMVQEETQVGEKDEEE